ncbi:MAG: M28 family metallopeptidase, partial [Candidatus Cloacimonetes bacterium]|nr:M28 family metallopeptidase [Candidatus Cloacimonadota bacterium]
MKKALFIMVLIVLGSLLIANTPISHIVRIDRELISSQFSSDNSFQNEQQLFNQIQVFHLTNNYILAGVDNLTLKKLPKNSYLNLAIHPSKENWYILTKLKNKANLVTSAMGKEVTRMDNVIILKSALSDIELASMTEMPIVRLDFIPMDINQSRPLKTEPSGRVDFGNLLTSVNADSIQWFMQQLQNFGTRNAIAGNRYDVAVWIRNQFIRMGITNAYIEPFFVQNYDQYNVVATIPGTLTPSKYIVIGGHHDSIVMDGNNPTVTAPGADDNASGTTACLEMARVMKANNYQPECSIRFVTFACEEYGLWGSKYHAQQALEQGQEIKLMINHDMISNSSQQPNNWWVKLNPYEGFMDYTYFAGSVTAAQTVLMPYGWLLNSASSDSHPFWQRGFPVVYFSEDEFCPFYHTVNDLVVNTNPQYAKEIIKASTAVCVSIDQMPSKVSNIVVNDTGIGSSLQVSWSTDNLETDVVSYKVYVTDNPDMPPIEYNAVSSPYILGNLNSGTLYFVGVAAVDNLGNVGMATSATGTPYTIPQTPAGFADAPGMHSVTLNWQPNIELDLSGYNLFRSLSPEGPFTLVNTAPIAVTSYTDNTVEDLLYYYYILTAVDQTSYESVPTEIIRSRGVTLNQGLLIVDETRNNIGNTVFAPNDATSDAFFDSVLQNFDRAQFDVDTDGNLRLADIGIYSSIFWHGNDFGNLTYPYQVNQEIQKYLQLGGKILISSYYPTQAFDNNANYPYTYAADSFMSTTFGIRDTDYRNQARFRYALPQNSGFPPLTVDSLKTLSALAGHIYSIASIGATTSAQNIYYYGSNYANDATQGVMNGMPVGVCYDNGAGKSIMLSFP